jgi:hypothetical protein
MQSDETVRLLLGPISLKYSTALLQFCSPASILSQIEQLESFKKIMVSSVQAQLFSL